MKSIKDMFPNASQSFVESNPSLPATSTPFGKQNDSTGNVARSTAKRGRMNKTESEFALILEAMKRKGEILRYEFEGMTLRFAGVKYTPDFVVFYERNKLIRCTIEGEIISTLYVPSFIEIKGGYTKGKFERAVERFRHAKTYYPEFQFEMWQKQKGVGWKQII